VARLLDGAAPGATPLEQALIVLVRKTCAAPARLEPADLDPLRALVGDGALDYTLVAASFHFINRMADLLHVEPEVLPARLRRLEPLRRLMVRAASVLMRRMDLRPRPYATVYDEAVAALAPVLQRANGKPPGDALLALRARPKLIESIRIRLEERARTSLDADTLASVHRTVEASLPSRPDDTEGFHPRPRDPVEAFAFVGTRYAYRTTDDTIAALRRAGFDDLGVLDLAIAVADANQWARLHRLVGVPAELFYAPGAK
jgi:alkylhydroperoxidase family enzyme